MPLITLPATTILSVILKDGVLPSCNPTECLPQACSKFDRAVLQGLQSIIPYKLDAPSLIQATLRLSNGGLGLRNTKLHHPAAYFASFHQSKELICGFTNHLNWNCIPHFSHACTKLVELIQMDDSPTQSATPRPTSSPFRQSAPRKSKIGRSLRSKGQCHLLEFPVNPDWKWPDCRRVPDIWA